MSSKVTSSGERSALPQCPEVAEESWRKSDPHEFFLPQDELLDFSGVPFLEGARGLGWKVTQSSASAHALKEALATAGLEAVGGQEALSVLQSDEYLSRLVLIEVAHGRVSLRQAEGLKSAVAVESRKADVRSVAPESAVGEALGARLSALCPHELVVKIKSASAEVPLLVVANNLAPTFNQSVANLRFEVEGSAQLLNIEGHSERTTFSHHRHVISLRPYAQCAEMWLHIGAAQNDDGRVLYERVVEVAEGAKFADAQFFVPSAHVRLTSNVVMQGRGGTAKSGAAVLGNGHAFLDYEPLQEHKQPGAKSAFHLMMLVASRARTVFQGLILVDREAPGSEAIQENRNLVLSKRARIDASPRLKISPQEVSCKHGSASGEIDEAQMYYLMSRGFNETEARALILEGFVRKAFTHFDDEHVFSRLSDALIKRSLESFVKTS